MFISLSLSLDFLKLFLFFLADKKKLKKKKKKKINRGPPRVVGPAKQFKQRNENVPSFAYTSNVFCVFCGAHKFLINFLVIKPRVSNPYKHALTSYLIKNHIAV